MHIVKYDARKWLFFSRCTPKLQKDQFTNTPDNLWYLLDLEKIQWAHLTTCKISADTCKADRDVKQTNLLVFSHLLNGGWHFNNHCPNIRIYHLDYMWLWFDEHEATVYFKYSFQTWISVTTGHCHITFKLHLVWLAQVSSRHNF